MSGNSREKNSILFFDEELSIINIYYQISLYSFRSLIIIHKTPLNNILTSLI